MDLLMILLAASLFALLAGVIKYSAHGLKGGKGYPL